MNRTSLNAFAARGAQLRENLYGDAFTSGELECLGSRSAITSTRQQVLGGWDVNITAVVRVVRANFPTFTPVKGALITFAATDTAPEFTYEISEIKDNPRSPEWVVGLINPQED